MCNPRRVMIHLARSIEESWRRTVEQTAAISGETAELAQINAEVCLNEEMGDMALVMLERVLSGEFEGFEPWSRDSLGHYHRQMDDVTLIYDPETSRLSIEAQLTESVTAEARAAAEVCGFTVGEVTAEAVGCYYDDGWSARTKESAEAEAQEKAERRLEDAIEALHHQQNPELFAEAEARARSDAEARAEEELIRLQSQTRDALRERLQMTLAQAEERVYHVMNRAVGEAYRQTLRQIVMDSGGRIITDQRDGAIINMELEI